MTEQQVKQEENNSNEEEKQVSNEIIEVDWEEIKDILILKQNLTAIETTLANFLLQAEKRKISFLDQIVQVENLALQKAKELRASKNIDETLTYELKLPEKQGEKAYFVRKDA
jgi:hypothetical protein